MKTIGLALLASVAATPVLAQETREMDAHVHGVSTLELVIEDGIVAINLLSPGMDIVGFEYEASTDADKDAVAAAMMVMLLPERIVTLPEAAGCRLTGARAFVHAGAEGDIEMEGDHDHDHDDDHAADAEDAQDEGATHSAFQAGYTFACDHPEDLTTVGLPFFAQFPNAQEIDVQYITEAGAGTAEILRDTALLTLD